MQETDDSVSHCSTSAAVVSLNTVPRIEGLLALKLLDIVTDVLGVTLRVNSNPNH